MTEQTVPAACVITHEEDVIVLHSAELMSRRQGPRLRIDGFSPTAIQAGKDGDRQSCVKVHRPFRQHCPAAFVASLHVATLTSTCAYDYPPEVLDSLCKGPSFRWTIGPCTLGCQKGGTRLSQLAS